MGNADKIFKVFVSSTSKDLLGFRKAARDAILEMGWLPDMQEYWEAMPEPTVEACTSKLDGCNLMVLIVAFRQGWVPTEAQGGNGQDSITALELEHARKNKINVLAFLANDDWPGKLWENDDQKKRAWVENFRNGLNLAVNFFGFESPAVKEEEGFPAFRTLLKKNLVEYKNKYGSPGELSYFDRAKMGLTLGRRIPFLGLEIYGKGPLSNSELTKALGDERCPEKCLASVAEYRERYLGGRDLFLSHLDKIIREQAATAAATPVPVYDLVLKFKPPLILSATLDLQLEQSLAAAKKDLLILCHVLRSAGGEQDGKILTFHGLNKDKPPDFTDADKILLPPLEELKNIYIIYKPLGSPLLHQLLNPDLEIDTVVITEADYGDLLGLMANKATGVPNPFTKFFQNNPFTFLGYPMDVWNYRLVGQVFKIAQYSKSSPLAVRKVTPGMEEMAWRKLGIDLLPMDPNDFARDVLEAP